ncbi:hypothetical protein AAMO2058_001329300 [Amorphochlora amoebiformis]
MRGFMPAMRRRRTNTLATAGITMLAGCLVIATVLSVRGTQSSLGAGVRARVAGPRVIPAGCMRASPGVQRMQRQWKPSPRTMFVRAEEEASAPTEEASPPEVQPTAEAAEEESKTLLKDLSVGDVVMGTVKGVVSFGAFLDIGAEKDGLLHVSDFGETGFIADASKFMKVGQQVEVKVKSVDVATQKLSLQANREARTSLDDLEIGSTVTGRIRNVQSFGGFVDIGAEKDGLLHISQLEGFVADINDVLKEGQEVKVRVTAVDKQNGKITLSMREEGSSSGRKPRQKQDISSYVGRSFDDKLEDGIRGLLPISFMSEGRIEKVDDIMKIGDTISVSVLSANTNDGKLSFTLIEPKTQDHKDDGDRKQKSPGGDRQSSYYDEITASYNSGATIAVSTEAFDNKGYVGVFGKAFQSAGFKMSEKAKNVLKDRFQGEHKALFEQRDLILKEDEAASKAVEHEAVAKAAEEGAAEVADDSAAEAEAPVDADEPVSA